MKHKAKTTIFLLLWTRSPVVDYSHIIAEAGMAMKKASGGDFSLRQGAGKSSRTFLTWVCRRWRLWNFSWNFSLMSGVFPKRGINRRRGGVGGALVGPDATQGLAVPGWGVATWQPPSGLLLT